jgi:predicted nucleic acid-binding protein
MTSVVLDAEALSALARRRPEHALRRVTAALQVAVEEEREVVVPAAVLAELYRGGSHDQAVDSCLGRHGGIGVVATDRPLARRVGNLLANAGRGSEFHVDATVVAAATASGGAVILTGDPDDVGSLAEGLPGVTVVPL